MTINLIITGVGGQGNVLASQIIGHAAVKKGLNVTIGETFGLSQRGGPVLSHIRLSENETYGPIIPPNAAHLIVGLEPLEPLRIMADFANPATIFIVNARPIFPLNVIAGDTSYPDLNWIKETLAGFGDRLYWMEATERALELGGAIMLNMIMVGALCTLDNFPIKIDDVKTVLSELFAEAKLHKNHQALAIGKEMLEALEHRV